MLLDYSSQNLYNAEVVLRGLRQSPKVTTLNISDNFLESGHIIEIMQCLKDKRIKLLCLNLSNCMVGQGVGSVGEYVKWNEELETLNMQNTHIGSRGVRVLAEAVSGHLNLNYLNIDYNSVGEAACVDLMLELGTCRSLRKFTLKEAGAMPKLRVVHTCLGLPYTFEDLWW